MECELCYENFDNEANAPLKVFCCEKTLCKACILSITSTTSMCPWDKTRWIARSVLKKCIAITPPKYLEILQLQSNNTQNDHMYPPPALLGEGKLADEYEQMLSKRLAEDSEQIENDIKLAKKLLDMEEEANRKAREEQALRDEKIARTMAGTEPDTSIINVDRVDHTTSQPTDSSTTISSLLSSGISSGNKWTQKKVSSSSASSVVKTSKLKSKQPSVTQSSKLTGTNTTSARPAKDIRSFWSGIVTTSSTTPKYSSDDAVGKRDDWEDKNTSHSVKKRRVDDTDEGLCRNVSYAAPPTILHPLQPSPMMHSAAAVNWPLYGGGSGCEGLKTVTLIEDESSRASSIAPEPWHCPVCTFQNCGHLASCEMCQYDTIKGGLCLE